jgi:exonuclease SbcD
MRLLHTSDLHIGQSFYGRSRQHEHGGFLDWLVQLAREREVDAVVVAGDVFDTSTPPSHAREQYNGFCADMAATGAQLVVVGGNHDSPVMLGETRRLLAQMSTRVIPEVGGKPEDLVFVVPRRDGTPGMVLCGVPYLRPRDVMRSEPGQSIDEKHEGLHEGVRALYAQIHARAEAMRAELRRPDLPIVATGHLATVGANTSDSVRGLSIGNLNAFPTAHLPAADYIALGHIHRPQKVGSHEHIRYCGAPLTLSFDEHGQAKQVLLIEFDGNAPKVESIPVPVFQPLARISGALSELPDRFRALAVAHGHVQPIWCEVTVDKGAYISDLMQQIAAMVESLPIEVLRVRRESAGPARESIEPQLETLDELTPAEVFEKRLAIGDVEEALHPRLRELFAEVVSGMDAGDAA